MPPHIHSRTRARIIKLYNGGKGTWTPPYLKTCLHHNVRVSSVKTDGMHVLTALGVNDRSAFDSALTRATERPAKRTGRPGTHRQEDFRGKNVKGKQKEGKRRKTE